MLTSRLCPDKIVCAGAPAVVSTIHLPENSVLCIAATDQYIFAGLGSGRIRCIDANSLKTVKDLDGHIGSVLSLTIVDHPCRRWLVSASADSTVRIWDLRILQPLWTLFSPLEIGDVLSVTYLHERLVYGSQSCAILWADVPETATSINGFSTPPPGLRYNKFFDSQSGSALSRAQALGHGQLHISPSGSVLQRTSSGTHIALDGTHTPAHADRCIAVEAEHVIVAAHCGYIYALESVTIESEDYLVSGSGDGAAKLWKKTTEGFDCLKVLVQDDEAAVLALAARDDGTVFIGYQGGVVRIVDLLTSTVIRKLGIACASDVMDLCISNDACIAVTSGGGLYQWNASFLPSGSFVAHDGIALCCASDGLQHRIYTGGNDGLLKIWHARGARSVNVVHSESLQGRMFKLLSEFVSFPSISAAEAHREECRQSAIWLKDTLHALGADSQLLSGAPGRNPLVLAHFSARPRTAQAPRKSILFYGHYDVVSATGQWRSGNPFALTGIGGYLYGRGVIDNKGPILAVACAAADLLEAGKLDVDLTMLIEGEEETDSAGLQDSVAKHRSEIGHVDAVLISNSYSLSEDIPSIMFGLRGRIILSVTVKSSNPDLHSGMHGGLCDEPLLQLTKIIGSLLDHDGKVAVPEFYDRIRPLSKVEEEAYDEVVERCSTESLHCLTSRSKYSEAKETLLHSWRMPSLSVHKIEVSGSKISTVIPASARAKISIRTVPDMPLKATTASVIEHIKSEFAKCGHTANTLDIATSSSAPWWIADPSHPYSRAAEQAVFDEWRVHPLWIREGGSLPSLPFLEQFFDATTVHLPMGNQGDHAHLVDEKTSILNLQRGKKVVQNWLQVMGEVGSESAT